MKRGKRITVNISEKIKASYGSVDTSDFKSIYLNIQSWVTPKTDESNWNKIVGNFSRSIKHLINDKINLNLINREVIVDVELKTSGILMGKKSFLNLEITLYPKPMIKFTDTALKEYVEFLLKEINGSIFDNHKYFDFFKQK